MVVVVCTISPRSTQIHRWLMQCQLIWLSRRCRQTSLLSYGFVVFHSLLCLRYRKWSQHTAIHAHRTRFVLTIHTRFYIEVVMRFSTRVHIIHITTYFWTSNESGNFADIRVCVNIDWLCIAFPATAQRGRFQMAMDIDNKAGNNIFVSIRFNCHLKITANCLSVRRQCVKLRYVYSVGRSAAPISSSENIVPRIDRSQISSSSNSSSKWHANCCFQLIENHTNHNDNFM